MRNIGRRMRWPLLGIAVALIAAGWLYLSPTESRDQRADKPAPHPAGVVAAAGPAKRAPGAPDPVAHPEGSEFSLPRIPPPLQRALDSNSDLAQYYGLEQKVLPTDEERANLHAMLSDPGMIRAMKQSLLAAETTYSKDAEAKRMVAVEFLSDAINWTDNPSRGEAMEAVEGVIFAENVSSDAPDDLAQSLMGDKMELYTQLLHRSPDSAALVAEHARGTAAEPLLAYTKESYDRETAVRMADDRETAARKPDEVH